ncbi:MAG: DUF58 domain-containing protein [Defluviitaleaceae bacterium]|nr:DUF58 domain-containing protein [Defluviitaleaceae bacterium]
MTALVVVICLALAIMAQRFVYNRFWNRNLNVEMSFSEKTAAEGSTVVLREVLSNAKILPLPWVAVKFQVSKYLEFVDRSNSKITDDYYRNDLFSVMMYQKITRRLPFVCAKRGYYTVKSLEVVSGNILMNAKFADRFDCRAALTVYPSPVPLDGLEAVFTRLLGSVLTKRFIHPDPFEFKGIREYQPYDSFRSINFKATAKTGGLMVNVNDYTVSQQVILMLNFDRYQDWLHEDLDEQAIRLAAALAERFVTEGVPVRFITNGADVITGRASELPEGSGAGHLANIFELLARIDLKKDPALFSNILAGTALAHKAEPLYLLISTYHKKDLTDAFAELEGLGAQSMWVLPFAHDTFVEIPAAMENKIVRWEAGV